MSLEDGTSDVIAKAMLGLGIDAVALAEMSGLPQERIAALLDGDDDGQALRTAAASLGLSPAALAALPGYLPAEREIPGVRRIELPFRQWTVNAWLVEAGGVRLLFDTGCTREDISRALGGIRPDAVFITHAHEDHVGGVAAMEDEGIRVISETEALAEKGFVHGPLRIRAIDLSGHMSPTAGYLIEGLGKLLLVPGDAIFAGSMGRCRSTEAYRTAFATLLPALREAGPDCVILPGHGPATTVAEELSSNPFLAAASC
ncbi:MBL fold metallo-hydrolase [Akkermansiaceae bacterium]|nr:MBL fold metallo-hydrolase [Akkermansiaceae bacterium]